MEAEFLKTFAHTAARAIEITGICIIIIGTVISMIIFIYRLGQKKEFEEVYHKFRSQLGRAILLGLEFLVAADIIGTVAVEPTFRNLGVLGLIVVIRTFLSFSLEVEINGHWPWQHGVERDHPNHQKI